MTTTEKSAAGNFNGPQFGLLIRQVNQKTSSDNGERTLNKCRNTGGRSPGKTINTLRRLFENTEKVMIVVGRLGKCVCVEESDPVHAAKFLPRPLLTVSAWAVSLGPGLADLFFCHIYVEVTRQLFPVEKLEPQMSFRAVDRVVHCLFFNVVFLQHGLKGDLCSLADGRFEAST